MRSIWAKRRFSICKQRKHGAHRQLRFARRRVPASDFRQFICRKSFYITGPPQNLFCGEIVHFPPAESGQKGRRGAFVPRAKCPPDPPVRPRRGWLLQYPSPASAAGLCFAPPGDEGREAFVSGPSSKKRRVYGRNMVPHVRSRAARFAVPQWRFRRNARDRKGELAGPQALTEGLWVSYRSGQPVTGRFLLYRTYNPSASHSRSTSPYTGEASPA